MSDVNLHMRWQELRLRLDLEAYEAKSPQEAVVRLSKAYSELPSLDRPTVDAVLAEWVESDSESKRFDALALIRDHRIASALPSLYKLARRLQISKTPGAPYELDKVREIMRLLSAQRNGA